LYALRHIPISRANMEDKKKPKFVYQPEYPGGPKALTKFIYEQLRYPKLALEAQVEGTVVVEYDIDYQGKVTDTRVLQSIGHGCDEEACRVLRLLRFDVPRNRGLKVSFHKKANIRFKKPKPQPAPKASQQSVQITYQITPATTAPPAQTEEKQPVITYGYTI
jgi:TonB family protein